MIDSANGENIFEYKFPEFINDNNEIGDCSDDFEVLQVLNSGTFGNVLKVKSKKNLEIYAIKKVDMDMVEKNGNKYYENERIILSKLRNPLLCKCYTTFEEEKYLYFVMEFMNNGDLNNYYDAFEKLNSKIPEEKIWDLLLKCLSALLYIHNQGLIHRDIKLDNIFLDENFNIKIGDFNVSAVIDQNSAENFTQDPQKQLSLISRNSGLGTQEYMSPEIKEESDEKRRYDQKTDVYSMGALFFYLCYGDFPYEKKDFKMKCYEKLLYSKDLNDIIDKMIQKDKEKRCSSLEAYTIVKKLFIEKYVKNTTIKSALSCFYNFPNFREYFLNKNNLNFVKKNNIEMGKSVFDLIQSFFVNNQVLIDSYLFDIKNNLENYGLNVKYYEEIEIEKFIHFFIKILNNILNEMEPVEKSVYSNEELEEILCLSDSFKFEDGQEENALNFIMNAYNKRLLSLISRNFLNVIKTKRVCMACDKDLNTFSFSNYIPIDVDILTKSYDNINNLNIKDGFKWLLKNGLFLLEDRAIKCDTCQRITIHRESKNFYHTSKNLIIIFNRGKNYENKTFINFSENLILNKNEVERFNEVRYQLLGMIEVDDKGNYLYFTKDKNNKWNGNNNNSLFFDKAKIAGTVVALFYYCSDDKMILQSNPSFKMKFTNPLLNYRFNNITNPSMLNMTRMGSGMNNYNNRPVINNTGTNNPYNNGNINNNNNQFQFNNPNMNYNIRQPQTMIYNRSQSDNNGINNNTYVVNNNRMNIENFMIKNSK